MIPYRLCAGLCILFATAQIARAGSLVGQGIRIDGTLAVGYYIEVLKVDPVRLKQDSTSNDPYHTYTGSGAMTLITGFPCQLSARAKATSTAGGQWQATIRPSMLAKGTAKVQVSVTGRNLAIDTLAAGTSMKVAEVTVTVIPRSL